MGPKQKKGEKGQLKVAKRGSNKDTKSNETPSSESSEVANARRGPDSSTTSQPKSPENTLQPNRRPRSRQASGVSPRKVSEGLKQLPPDAYRFVRESYLMLDSDGSGEVSKEAIRDMLASLGLRDSNDKQLNAMLQETGEPITFAAYLAVMGEMLSSLPSREEMDLMLEAFRTTDGSFDEAKMKEALLIEGLSPEIMQSVLRRFAKPSRYGQTFDSEAFASAMSI